MENNNIGRLRITRTGEFYAYAIFILLFIANYSIGSSIYSFALLFFAIVLAIRYKPTFMIILCMLSDTMQGYFMITKTLSFNRVLAIIVVLSYIIHYRRFNISKFSIIPIGLSIYVLSSSLWSVTGSFGEAFAFMISMVLIIMMEAFQDVNKDELYRLFNIAFILYGFSLAILTIVRAGGLNVSQFVFDESFNANTICSSLALSASVIYGTYSIGRGLNKIISYGFVGVCIVSILLIGSRASLISLLASLTITYIYANKTQGKSFNPKTIIAFVLVVIAIGATIYFVMRNNPDIYYRFTFSSANVKDMYSVTRRTDVWNALIRYIIPQNLFLGVGFGLLNVKTVVAPYVQYAKHAHNMYLAILSETGIFGSLFFLTFFIHYFIRIINSKNIDKVFILAILTFAMVNGIAEEMINQRWMWLSFGLCDVLLKSEE